jgi:hypothetical protein
MKGSARVQGVELMPNQFEERMQFHLMTILPTQLIRPCHKRFAGLRMGFEKAWRPSQQLLLLSLPLAIWKILNLRSCLLGHIHAKMVNEYVTEYSKGKPLG